MRSICSNQVKGECGEAEKSVAMTQLQSLNSSLKTPLDTSKNPRSLPHVGQYSLLRHNFRKPATVTSQSSKNSSAEARRMKITKKIANPQTITHSRMNLLRALSKVKSEGNVPFDDNARYARSDEDCSDKSSSNDGTEQEAGKVTARKRRSPNGVHSEESSDGDYMKFYPALPLEPPPKKDFNQEEFLALFNLITPEVAESLKLRRSERKRRNCTKNEKNDFHYGKFDLNEVSCQNIWSLQQFAKYFSSHFRPRSESE